MLTTATSRRTSAVARRLLSGYLCGPTMIKGAHLWAVGFDDTKRAEHVRSEIMKLGESQCLVVLDTAVVVHHADGIVTLNGEPFVSIHYSVGHSFACFLAGLALGAPPLT